MKVSTEKTEGRQVVLEIGAEAEEVERSLDGAYKRLVQRAQVPGFRKGKAPRDMLERYIGRGALLEEALERLVPQLLNQAINEQGLEPIAQPEIEITQIEPLTFKATVPLSPTVELGDYRNISIEQEPVSVSDEDVDHVIQQLRAQQGTWVPVERPVQFGDMVTINVTGNADGKDILDKKDLQIQVHQGIPFPVPGFSEQLEGMVKGQDKEFTIALPDENAAGELAGKDCIFKVNVGEIKEQHLPELDDEFAKSLGQGFETADALREDIASHLQDMAQQNARRSYEDKAIDALIESSTIEFPAVIAEKEIDRLISGQESELQARKLSLEDYLRSQNKSREELREELKPIAIKNISGSLALGKLAEAEKIEVSAAELDEEIEIMATNAGEQGENMRQLFQSPGTRKSLENVIITRKTVQRLVQIASGEAEAQPAEAEPQAEQVQPQSNEAQPDPDQDQPEAAGDESKSGTPDTD